MNSSFEFYCEYMYSLIAWVRMDQDQIGPYLASKFQETDHFIVCNSILFAIERNNATIHKNTC